MKIIVAKYGGFCQGIQKAVDLALRENRKHPVCTLGSLLHNTQFTEKLAQQNIHIIDDIHQHKGRYIITRSHGISREVLEQAQKENIPVIESTCIFVKKARRAAQKLQKEGRKVIIIGDPKHPEIIGINSFIAYKGLIIDSLDEAKQLPYYKTVGVLSQTTHNREIFNSILIELKKHCYDLRVIDTICNATKQRQEEAQSIAQKVDVMIIVGGKHSQNTKELLSICQKYTSSYHIEIATELQQEWFKTAKTVGIALGSSTPKYISDVVLEKLKEF